MEGKTGWKKDKLADRINFWFKLIIKRKTREGEKAWLLLSPDVAPNSACETQSARINRLKLQQLT